MFKILGKKNVFSKIKSVNYIPIKFTQATSLKSEVDTAKSLENHPFLLMVLEGYHERDTGKVVLFAELMKRSLYDVIAAGECPLPENRIKTYTYQMLEGTIMLIIIISYKQ